MRAFDVAASMLWAILPEYLQTILESAARVDSAPEATAERIARAIEKREARDGNPAAVETRKGEVMPGARTVRVRGDAPGVAIIPVTGPIFRYANLFTAFSGGTSTELLARDIQAAIDNPQIKALLLNIDSPGGEAFGINELANVIAASPKPVTAYVSGAGASGAYWLAAAADEIVIDDMALIGSIGVVMAVPDSAKRNAAMGVYEFVSSQSPNKRPKVDSESGAQRYQTRVDDMAAVFIAAVATHRGVSEEKVINDFGAGDVLVGKKAVKAGLADRIGSFEAVLAEMGAGKWKKKKKTMATADAVAETENEKPEMGNGGSMNLWEQLKAALSGEQPGASTQPAQQPPAQQQQTVATQPAPPAAENDELKKLRADLEREKLARLTAEAEGFINAKIVAGKALPAAKPAFVRDYVRAALDDEARPVADGEPSRVDSLKARFDGGKPHKMTMELVKSEVPKGAQVLDDNADPEAAELSQLDADTRKFAERANGKKRTA